LDSLIAKKLITTRLGERGYRFVATPIDSLDILIADHEHKLDQLRATLPPLKMSLVSLQKESETQPQVFYYHGIDGLKQVTHNSLKSKGELLIYEIETMSSFMGYEEAERYRLKFVENKIKTRTLTNLTEIKGWTNVTEMVEHYWEMRHLPSQDKPFQFEILIYNDVYCMYRYNKPDIFCVEIHSAELADMQRQLFEYLWAGARKFKVLDDHGTATLI